MRFPVSKQRLYATALALGAGVLLVRAIWMLGQEGFERRVWWVSVLLVSELLVDAGCLAGSLRWWIANDSSKARFALRLGVAAALLHVLRVVIFLVGRVGPWIDFDVRPEQRVRRSMGWDQGWLTFAVIMSVLGVVGVVVIWILRRRRGS
jgi:hypothetical protein